MKIAIFSESSSDESAVRVLVDAVLGKPSEPISVLGIRTRGWPAVRRTLPTVLRQLHYRGDADGLVVVVDSDDSPIHEPAHDAESGASQACRLCQLRAIIEKEYLGLKPIQGRQPLRVAIGLAVPAIEAWLLAGTDVHITEAAWSRGLQARRPPFSRQELKRRAYEVEPAPLALQTARMNEMALRLAADLSVLERHFPSGFGPFAKAIREW